MSRASDIEPSPQYKSGSLLKLLCQRFKTPFYTLFARYHFTFNEENIAWLNRVENCLFVAKRLEHLDLLVEILERRTSFSRLFNKKWPNLSHVSLKFDFDYESFVNHIYTSKFDCLALHI